MIQYLFITFSGVKNNLTKDLVYYYNNELNLYRVTDYGINRNEETIYRNIINFKDNNIVVLRLLIKDNEAHPEIVKLKIALLEI